MSSDRVRLSFYEDLHGVMFSMMDILTRPTFNPKGFCWIASNGSLLWLYGGGIFREVCPELYARRDTTLDGGWYWRSTSERVRVLEEVIREMHNKLNSGAEN
jgi:hypothetical protein